ncbi:hypothetical protein EMIHUDRAFT_198033 [Emiliania huxleyi CCMP1516]|uniref:Solute-binding protein family 5 domain-containing protein n=2 Tax=Emiliania huxleyi TaxID=2903 RepID=A0A0D3IE59_EMIH1|nr:hypothetical protein EMIHUDRAFT_198033 [Emiliania huxleyi CCMP1516]EOD09544.1 hypothetical protein EMIHUDRAFT_198033 [Emiliania huxleyi CCMP1516]|eukprot:XP_005761973.1 hypothetical protein EMIHUDRAFT_198033 [Emiliania huxleyi CCMP1516]
MCRRCLLAGGAQHTFTLREGVKFHDGSDWNCAVAKLNFDHVLSPTVKQRHAWLGTEPSSCNSAGQFVLETKNAFYPLLQELSYIRPLSRNQRRRSRVDIKAVFARHDDYWGGAPEIEFLHIRYYETRAAAHCSVPPLHT